jgi:hypothetical protein
MNRTESYAIYLHAAIILAFAGMSPAARAADVVPAEPQPESFRDHPFTLGIEGGTTGFGGAFSWRFADHWGARVGVDYMAFSDAGVEVQDLHYSTQLRLLSEPVTLDIYPWKSSSLHLSAGLLLNQNRLTGTADNGTIIVNGQPVTIEALGQLDMKVEQQPVNPYLSLGGNLFYFDRAHRWALGGELGVVYTGDPRTSLTRSGPPSALADAALATAQQQLDQYAEKFKWWPIAKLQMTFSF